MKKYLIILVGVISLLGVSTVKADTYSVDFNYVNNFKNLNNAVLSLVDRMLDYYNDNLKNNYPYYSVVCSSNPSVCDMLLYDAIPINFSLTSWPSYSASSSIYLFGSWHESNGNIDYTIYTSSQFTLGSTNYISNSSFFPYYYFDSNFDAIYSGNDTLSFYDENNDLLFTLENGDVIPTFKSLFIDNPMLNYTEIDLNNYSYVALSLKNYNVEEEFYTTMQVKGNYCLTPVYDYGLTEKKDVITGSKNQGCSPYYENYTPVRTYILESDIKNHAIYYLKAYDTSRDNKVKVDTSIFNIHYISSEEANNPILNINGKKYSSIPYSELTDSATISEEEGYVSGATCTVGDFNCMSDYTGFKFSDIFTKPLEFFKDLWSSIAKVFELVAMLVALLPTPIQYFFYISFMLAVIIGLIKIIL